MKKYTVLAGVVAMSVLFGMCRKAEQFTDADYDERLSGGAATVFDETSKALGHELPGLNERDSRIHAQGDAAFGQTFVTDPAPRFGGLGPVYNNVSCIACHHNDGKGTPTAGTVTSSLLVRVSTGLKDPHGGPGAVDGYGNQIQDIAIHGVPAEAKVSISYSDKVVTYPDGKIVTLRAPVYTLTNSYIPLAGHSLSPRLAPPVFGLGLLEDIPEATILSFEQQNRQNADAIRGHANRVYNPQNGQMTIGRFGLKANTANIFVQVASAYLQDMGVTSSLFPLESCNGQTQMSAVINPGKPNLPDSILNQVVFYVRSLSVPARRDVADKTVLQGQQLFTQLRCSGCHIPTLRTGVDLAFPQLSNQRIHPYTDLLLHDMGTDLADGYMDYEATGNDWKTPALWGIGLYEKTNGTAYYLHDGRARSMEEAILWHGGEAKASRDQFMQLPETDRQALLRFLKSL